MKKLLFFGILFLVFVGVYLLKDIKTQPAASYKTVPLEKGEIIESVTATGTVNAVTTVKVGSQISGTIKQINVDYNSRVKKGELIALIDPVPFEVKVEDAKANLLLAKANVKKAEALMVDAKRIFERNKELSASDLIARSELDTSLANYEAQAASYEVAKAQLQSAEAALRLAKTNLGYTRIYSPVNGIVISRDVDVGQTIAASFQTPTLFTIAQDLTKMQIDTNVDEADIGRIRVGNKVEFSVDAYPEKTFKGEVVQIRMAPIVVQNVVTYDVVVGVDNNDLLLMPGMTANVSIITSAKRGVLKIPNAALRFSPKVAPEKREMKGPSIWVLEGDKPVQLFIRTGVSNGSFTELLEGNITEGAQIIVEETKKTDKKSMQHFPGFF